IEPVLTVPIGLALAGEVQKGLRRISLLPGEVAVQREQRRQAVLVGGVGAGLAAVLLVAWAAKASQVSDERRKASDAEQQGENLRQQEAKLKGATTLGTEVTQREAQVSGVLANDVAWTRLFHDVATVIPSDVWLTSFSGQKAAGGGTVTFAARGFDHTSTARWLLRIGDLRSLSGLWVP